MTSPNEPRPTPLAPRTLLTGELPGVLSSWPGGGTPAPAVARTLLALWAGLLRLAPGAADPDEEALHVLVQGEAGLLARTALAGALFDAGEWEERVRALDRAWDAGEEDQEELDWQAHVLFEELDRAALTAWALAHLPGKPPSAHDLETLQATRQAVDRAETLLESRIDLFLCLATDVAAVLSAVRPGLAESDSWLAATLLKYRRIEEERDRLETPPDPAALLASARTAAAPLRLRRLPEEDWAWLPEPPLMMAANVTRSGGIVHRHWREPGGAHTATLTVDRADPATPLRVNFYRGDEPAVDLAGEPAWLAGCESTIDTAGNADFAQEPLRQAHDEGRPVTLEVGSPGLGWEPAAGPKA